MNSTMINCKNFNKCHNVLNATIIKKAIKKISGMDLLTTKISKASFLWEKGFQTHFLQL
jgi:hypothetical protein